ncbi:MAG: DUF2817 domain-containing protein [Bacteroidales bacterium]|nr:DUF2817 domain-containing protein [Bacteroidales bacterium]
MSKRNFYHSSYQECRNAFLCAVGEVKHLQTSIEAMPVSESQDGLFTDIVHFKNKGENPLVVITSGLHGIEGYVGSALQVFLLNQIMMKKLISPGLIYCLYMPLIRGDLSITDE